MIDGQPVRNAVTTSAELDEAGHRAEGMQCVDDVR